MPTLMLPEELLHTIVRHLAYNPNIIERELLLSPRQYCASALLPLSVASHQFRRICLQLLFNHVKVRRVGELRKLQGHCLLNDTFAACIRTLDITDMFGFEADYELLSQILPHLRNLLCLLMLDQIHATSKLFQAIRCHPSATIAISSFWNLPQGLSDHSDLRKIIVRALHIYGNEGYSSNYFDQLRDCGMQIKWVAIDQPGFLKEPFGMIRFSGLVELQLRMKSSPVDFASFNEFSCAHPHLRKICFADFDHSYFREQSNLMFMEPFLDVLARDGLAAATRIRGFAVTRNTSIPNVLSHWNVTSLFLTIAESSEQVLQLASLLYPEISILTIVHAPCTVDELIASLGRFPSLKIVGLLHTFEQIEFGIDEPWQDPSIVEAYEGPMIGPIATEFAMNWCISRIAMVVPSIEAFYIKEEGYDGPNLTGENWHIYGWILVHDMHRENLPLNDPVPLYITPLTRRPGRRPGSRSIAMKYYDTTFFV